MRGPGRVLQQWKQGVPGEHVTHADVEDLQGCTVMADRPQTLVCKVRLPHPTQINLAQTCTSLLHDLQGHKGLDVHTS